MDQIIKLPDNFIERIQKLLPDAWEEFLRGYDAGDYHGLRFNRIKTPAHGACDERICAMYRMTERIPWAADAFYYEEEQARPGAGVLHEAGAFYIQEPSAMGVVNILDPQPGDKVLDLCAAPGGKSTGALSKLAGRGLLVANEIVPNRAKILSSNLERMGATNAVVTNESPDALEERFGGFFDKIIVDAPCSGEGMFRKNPEALTEWSPEQVCVCANRQRLILESADRMLAPGGRLVYSTCTFSHEENEETMQQFLAEHPAYREVPTEIGDTYFARTSPGYRLWPHLIRGEGHYICLLQKGERETTAELDSSETAGEELTTRKKEKKKSHVFTKAECQLIYDVLGEILVSEKQEEITADPSRLLRFGEEVYLLPEAMAGLRLDGIHVLRPGLHLGTLKKGRFEPAHALAMSLGTDDVSASCDMEENTAIKYLKGEELDCEAERICEEATQPSGWCLMTCMGYSLGWGKRAANRIKNHYPKGLRKQVYML